MLRHHIAAIVAASSLIGGAHHAMTTAFHKPTAHIHVSTYHPAKIKTFTIPKIRVPKVRKI